MNLQDARCNNKDNVILLFILIAIICLTLVFSCMLSETFANTIVCMSMAICAVIIITLIRFPPGPVGGRAHSLGKDHWLLRSVGLWFSSVLPETLCAEFRQTVGSSVILVTNSLAVMTGGTWVESVKITGSKNPS